MTWQTHEITNQFDELQNYNLLATDTPLREALARAGVDGLLVRLDLARGQHRRHLHQQDKIPRSYILRIT
jgi:hypothetical protein